MPESLNLMARDQGVKIYMLKSAGRPKYFARVVKPGSRVGSRQYHYFYSQDEYDAYLRRKAGLKVQNPPAFKSILVRIGNWLFKAQLGMFGEEQEVQRPGSRGGKFYYTEQGKIVYGTRPVKKLKKPEPKEQYELLGKPAKKEPEKKQPLTQKERELEFIKEMAKKGKLPKGAEKLVFKKPTPSKKRVEREEQKWETGMFAEGKKQKDIFSGQSTVGSGQSIKKKNVLWRFQDVFDFVKKDLKDKNLNDKQLLEYANQNGLPYGWIKNAYDESEKEKMKSEKGKEPWEMTKEQYLSSAIPRKVIIELEDKLGRNPSSQEILDWQKREHPKLIKQALAEGKDVPEEVLKDYPELKAKQTIRKEPIHPLSRTSESDVQSEQERGVSEKGKVKSEGEFEASSSGIDKKIAASSHLGTSFDPEKRAQQEIEDFKEEVQSIYDKLKQNAKSDDQKKLLKEEMERFQAAYAQKKNELLSAKGRIVSPMIAGPSNFPARQMEKRNKAYDNKYAEISDWKRRAISAIEKKLKGQATEEAGGELAQLEQKINQAEKLQEHMKSANAIVRKKISDEDKIKEIVKIGLSEKIAREILKPDYAGNIGFPSLKLTNNNANIKRMKQRLEELKKREGKSGQESIASFKGAKIINNNDDQRIQIFFDQKPSNEIISDLKRNGWHWSPSNKAWQRKNTEAAVYDSKRIIENHFEKSLR